MSTSKLLLVAVIGVGAVLRFWNIHAGLPYRVAVDEPVITERAINMMRTGSFHPGFWDYPGLYIYLQLLVGCVRYVTGAMSGAWRSLNEFHPDHVFAWTRLLNATIGTVTIAMVYRAGVRWGELAGLIAAVILAVWPNHVRESHFALTDVPLTFFTVATLLMSLRAVERGTRTPFVAAGACAGMAAATKYPGAFAIVLPLAASAVQHGRASERVLNGGIAIASWGAAFLAAAPYTLLDLPGFLNGFGALARYYSPRDFNEGGGLYAAHLRAAIGFPGLITLAAGLVWGTVRAIRNRGLRQWVILTSFPLIFSYYISTKSLIFARYLLPAVPFLCLIMAIAVSSAITHVWRVDRARHVRVALVAGVLSVLLFPVVRGGIEWPAQYGRPTTQDVAYQRILDVIPKGSGVVVERSVLRLPESLYHMTNVPHMTMRRPEDYISRSTRFLVASSDAFGPVLDRPSENAAAYEAYQRVFSRPGHCLPAIQPTQRMTGQQIIICRFDAPIDLPPQKR